MSALFSAVRSLRCAQAVQRWPAAPHIPLEVAKRRRRDHARPEGRLWAGQRQTPPTSLRPPLVRERARRGAAMRTPHRIHLIERGRRSGGHITRERCCGARESNRKQRRPGAWSDRDSRWDEQDRPVLTYEMEPRQKIYAICIAALSWPGRPRLALAQPHHLASN